MLTLDTDKLTEYPYQMWYDYHKKYVQSITITAGGSGYEVAPSVTVLGGTAGSTGPFQIQGYKFIRSKFRNFRLLLSIVYKRKTG